MPSSSRFARLLRATEKYTKTDMVYLTQNGSWLLLGQVASAVIAFALAVVFGHYASQDLYGNYKYVLAMAGMLGAFSLSGLSPAVTQAVAKGMEGALRRGYWLSLRYSFPLVLIAFGSAAYEHFYAHNDFLAAAFICIGVFTPFMNAFSLFDAFLVGKKDFRRGTLYGTGNLLFPALILIAAIFLTKRAIVIILLYFVTNTIAAAWFYTRSLRQVKNQDNEQELLGYSTHLSIMNIIGTVADRIDSIAVFYFLGPVPLAVYSFAVAMPEQIKGLVKLLGPLSFPRFAQRSFTEIRRTMMRRILLFSGIIGVGVGIYVLAAPLIFRIFFPLYVEAVPYSQMYAISILLTGIVTPIVAALQAHKKTKELYIATNSGSILLIILTPALTGMFGIIGALASQIAYRTANAIFAVWQFLAAKEQVT